MKVILFSLIIVLLSFTGCTSKTCGSALTYGYNADSNQCYHSKNTCLPNGFISVPSAEFQKYYEEGIRCDCPIGEYCEATTEISVAEYGTYMNAYYSIEYPDDWIIKENSSTLTIEPIYKNFGDISIIKLDASETSLTLDEYTDLITKTFQEYFTDFVKLKADYVVIDETATSRIFYSANIDGIHCEFVEHILFHNKNSYHITYRECSDKSNIDSEEVQNIINSFKFVEGGEGSK